MRKKVLGDRPLLVITDVTAVVFLCLAFIAMALYGTSPDALLALPGYALLSLAGVFSLPGLVAAALKGRGSLALAGVTLMAAYFIWRALRSPVSYFAREDILLVCGGWVSLVVILFCVGARGWERAILCVVGGGALLNAIAAGAQFGGYDELCELPYSYLADYRGRSGGFFGNPNHGAAFCALGALACGCLAVFSRSKVGFRMVAVFCSVICVFGVVLAKSRGGALGVVAGFAVLAFLALVVFLRSHGKKRWGVMLLSVLLVLGGVVGAGAVGKEVLGTRFQRQLVETSKNDVRRHIWNSAILQFEEEPIVGTGSRTFTDYCWKFRMPEMQSWTREADFVHNDHLQLIAEYGIVGLVLGWGILVFFVWKGVGRLFSKGVSSEFSQRAGGNSGIAFGVAGIVAMAVQGVVEFQNHVPVIFVSIAMASGMVVSGRLKGGRFRKISGWVTVALMVGVVGAAGVFLPKYLWGAANYIYVMEKVRSTGGGSLGVVRLLGHALEKDPGLLPAWEQLAYSRIQLSNGIFSGDPGARVGMLQQALDANKSALAIRPNSVPLLTEAGRISDELGMVDEAEFFFAKAVEWAPLYGQVRNAQGMHYFKRGDWDRAREVFDEALKSRVAHDRSFTKKMLRTLDALEKTNP